MDWVVVTYRSTGVGKVSQVSQNQVSKYRSDGMGSTDKQHSYVVEEGYGLPPDPCCSCFAISISSLRMNPAERKKKQETRRGVDT